MFAPKNVMFRNLKVVQSAITGHVELRMNISIKCNELENYNSLGPVTRTSFMTASFDPAGTSNLKIPYLCFVDLPMPLKMGGFVLETVVNLLMLTCFLNVII